MTSEVLPAATSDKSGKHLSRFLSVVRFLLMALKTPVNPKPRRMTASKFAIVMLPPCWLMKSAAKSAMDRNLIFGGLSIVSRALAFRLPEGTG